MKQKYDFAQKKSDPEFVYNVKCPKSYKKQTKMLKVIKIQSLGIKSGPPGGQFMLPLPEINF